MAIFAIVWSSLAMTDRSFQKRQRNKKSITSECKQRLVVDTVSFRPSDFFHLPLLDLMFTNLLRAHGQLLKTVSWVTPHKITRLFLHIQHMRMQKKADPFTTRFFLPQNLNRSENGIANSWAKALEKKKILMDALCIPASHPLFR